MSVSAKGIVPKSQTVVMFVPKRSAIGKTPAFGGEVRFRPAATRSVFPSLKVNGIGIGGISAVIVRYEVAVGMVAWSRTERSVREVKSPERLVVVDHDVGISCPSPRPAG